MSPQNETPRLRAELGASERCCSPGCGHPPPSTGWQPGAELPQELVASGMGLAGGEDPSPQPGCATLPSNPTAEAEIPCSNRRATSCDSSAVTGSSSAARIPLWGSAEPEELLLQSNHTTNRLRLAFLENLLNTETLLSQGRAG